MTATQQTPAAELRSLLLQAAKSPATDPLCCQVVADYCDDRGCGDLAYALRWAAWQELRPEVRVAEAPVRWERWSWPLPSEVNFLLVRSSRFNTETAVESWLQLAADLAVVRCWVLPPDELVNGSRQ